MLTAKQRGFLETMKEHGEISEYSFGLTFEPAEIRWAIRQKYVVRRRRKDGVWVEITEAGAAAIERGE